MQNLDFIDYLNTNERDTITEEKEELINGLKNSNQKKINPKYFYDQKGSILFEKITKSNDYYPTKKEMEILNTKNKNIKRQLPAGSSVIEFGSGSNKKIKRLLKDKVHLMQILKKGKEKANIIAEENLKNIREKVGLI